VRRSRGNGPRGLRRKRLVGTAGGRERVSRGERDCTHKGLKPTRRRRRVWPLRRVCSA